MQADMEKYDDLKLEVAELRDIKAKHDSVSAYLTGWCERYVGWLSTIISLWLDTKHDSLYQLMTRLAAATTVAQLVSG